MHAPNFNAAITLDVAMLGGMKTQKGEIGSLLPVTMPAALTKIAEVQRGHKQTEGKRRDYRIPLSLTVLCKGSPHSGRKPSVSRSHCQTI